MEVSAASRKARRIKADREFWESVERTERERKTKVELAARIAGEGLTGPCPCCGGMHVPVAKKHGWYGELICLEHNHLGEVCAGVGRTSATVPWYRTESD